MEAATLKVKRLECLTLRVEVTTQLKFRLWLGIALLRLAALVMNCSIEIKK